MHETVNKLAYGQYWLDEYFCLVSAVSGTNLFAGTGGGVFLSTNNGTSWTQTGLTQAEVLALAVSGTNLFAGTSTGEG